MSKSSGGSFISVPTIIFLIVMYNIFFGDDEDKKDVKVKVDDTPAITEQKKDDWSGVKESLKTAVNDAKEIAIELKDELTKELASEDEEEKPESVEKPKEKAPVVVAEPDEPETQEEETGRKL